MLGTSANGIREWGRPGSSPENLGLVMGPTGRHNYESASKDRRGYITLKQARSVAAAAPSGQTVVVVVAWCLTGHPKKCSLALQRRSTYRPTAHSWLRDDLMYRTKKNLDTHHEIFLDYKTEGVRSHFTSYDLLFFGSSPDAYRPCSRLLRPGIFRGVRTSLRH